MMRRWARFSWGSVVTVAIVAIVVIVGGVVGGARVALAQLDPLACTADKTFYARGDHWAVVPPVASHPIAFVHQAAGPVQTPALPLSDAVAAVDEAFSRWQSVVCRDAATPNIAFVDASAGGAYFETRGPGDDTSSANIDDWVFNNVIYWAEGDWGADSATVAQTTTISTTDTGFIVTADLEFNGVDFDWRARSSTTGAVVGCVSGGENCFDVFSVALHEIGHFIGFDHVQCTNAVMFPQAAPSVELTGLSGHEVAGVCHIYRPRQPGVADRDTGEQCFSSNQCPGEPEHVCIQPFGFEGGSDFGWCAQTCTSTDGCPIGFVCATHGNGTQFCLPGIHLPGVSDGGGGGGGDCGVGQWECGDGNCIRDVYRCDGWDDCGDASDESSCASTSGGGCDIDQFTCPSGECTPSAWACDGIPDCSDGADEAGCDCETGQWGCRDGSCIAAALVCDGFQHCAGGSDEGSCTCAAGQFTCGDGSCVPRARVCDDVVDCNNAGDEARCGHAATGSGTGDQALGDLCAACSQGAHCGSGICVDDGAGGGICSQGCLEQPGFGCPSGFACVESTAGSRLCFPESAAACERDDTRRGLNEYCYLENGVSGSGEPWAAICGPGLVCMRFLVRAQGQEGACVRYCNAVDPAQACPIGLTCCNRIDATTGACVPPSVGFEHGGCFEIRQEGDSCVVAEQSVCTDATQCVNFGQPALSRCYKICENSADAASCGQEQQCIVFQVTGSTATLNVCCNGDVLDPASAATSCEPQTSCLFDVGVGCGRDTDCRQGQCLHFGGVGACSRVCDAVTRVGCPAAADDVNGDGVADGAFECRLISGVGQCWPVAGPIDPPACARSATIDDGDDGEEELAPGGEGCGGCSMSRPAPLGDGLLGLLPWAALLLLWRNRGGRSPPQCP